ncbi:hypothetical protein ScalyP_jg5703 [Parmales sp. scaly parma]|nr:hypothetical protein ScalyP_jg5703 [Parmales sp. scaly parma]
MGAEMAFYIGFKVLMNDFVLWIPGLEGTLKYIFALLVHVITKVLVDFTGLIHCLLRAADESRVGEQQRANNFHRNIRLHDRADERHDRL